MALLFISGTLFLLSYIWPGLTLEWVQSALAYPSIPGEPPNHHKWYTAFFITLKNIGLAILNLRHGMVCVLLIVLLLFCLSQLYFAKKMAFLGLLCKNPSILFTYQNVYRHLLSPPLSPLSFSFLFCLSTSSSPSSFLTLFSPPSSLAPREEQPSQSHLLCTVLVTVSYILVLRKFIKSWSTVCINCSRSECEGYSVSFNEAELPHCDSLLQTLVMFRISARPLFSCVPYAIIYRSL